MSIALPISTDVLFSLETDAVSESETQSNGNEKPNEESYHITPSYNDIVRGENSNSNFMSATNFIRKNIYVSMSVFYKICQ